MKTLDTFSPYKYINHLDRFIDLAEGKDIIPVMVELDLVNFVTITVSGALTFIIMKLSVI